MLVEAIRFEQLRILRNVPTVFFSLAFPVMLLGIFGAMYGNEPNELFGGLGTVDVSVPSYMALVIAVTGLMSFPLTMAEYRDRGILRSLRVTPANPVTLLAAQLVVNVAVTTVGIVLLIAVGVALFDLSLAWSWLAFVPCLALSLLSIYSIGFLVAALAPNERSATLLANLVYFPMIFLSGATVPYELLPASLQWVARALPLHYAVELLQGSWTEGAEVSWAASAAVLVGTTVVCSALALRFFRWE